MDSMKDLNLKIPMNEIDVAVAKVLESKMGI